tara:strand:- start:1931 stop:2110 length:180 start_codon:yes stop_codon:yes gene_type:complete
MSDVPYWEREEDTPWCVVVEYPSGTKTVIGSFPNKADAQLVADAIKPRRDVTVEKQESI